MKCAKNLTEVKIFDTQDEQFDNSTQISITNPTKVPDNTAYNRYSIRNL